MCCGKAIYEQVAEQTCLTRRQMLRVMGVGAGIPLLNWLASGCSYISSLQSDLARSLEAQRATPNTTLDLIAAFKNSWREVFYALVKARESATKNAHGYVKAKVKEAKRVSIKACSKMDEFGLSNEIDERLKHAHYNKELALRHFDVFVKEFLLEHFPVVMTMLEEAVLIIHQPQRWREIAHLTLQAGGFSSHVRRTILNINEEDLAFNVYYTPNSSLQAQQEDETSPSLCALAMAACAAAAAAAAFVCASGSDDCETAVLWALAVCAAACIPCGCGDGEEFTP